MQYFTIGDICFSWDDSAYRLEHGGFIEQFRTENPAAGQICAAYTSRFVSLEHYQNARRLRSDSSYEMYQTEEGRLLIHHWATCRFALGIWPERIRADRENICYFHPDMTQQIPMSAHRLFSIAGMHSILLQNHAPILHASYIDWNGSAILFAAPSQTGKSTQSHLWMRCAGAEIINDDRVLLRRTRGVWNAYGYPCCGSSEICINRTLPVRAIVILEQGPENRVVQMPEAQKIRTLVSGIEVYLWSMEEIDLSFHLAEQLAREVPVIKFICRPDDNAVDVLKQHLEEE